ncbi:MAG: hypothetical protein JST98_06140 [Bacteroidetes bacterium]|nr:hypothetical protein [Bacteroidota bacterium]
MLVTVDWLKLVQLTMPQWWRRKRFVTWLIVLISQVRVLHSTFLAYRKASLYSLRISGQTIYLEKALNDRFAFPSGGIWIENMLDTPKYYLYNKVEVKPPPFWYNKWSSTGDYRLNERVVNGTAVYRALQDHPVGEPMASPHWGVSSDRTVLTNRGEATPGWSFIIHVPAAVVFDEAEMRAMVDTYKLAGKTYTIQTY